MQTVSEVLGSAGAGESVTALGRTFTVMPVTQRIKAEFESWLKTQARLAVLESKPEVDAQTYQDMLSSFNTDAAGGKFRWQGEAMRKALSDLPGMCYLGWLLMRDKQTGITEDEVLAIYQDNMEGFGEALREAIRGGLPNSRTPAVTNGTPGDKVLNGGKSTPLQS